MPEKGTTRTRARRQPPVDRICATCQRPFKAWASLIAKGYGNYCSKPCWAVTRQRTIVTQCAVCETPLTTIPSRVAVGKGHYCSQRCAATGTKGTLAERFERQISPTIGNACVEWRGACNPHGYGYIYEKFPKRKLAHRVAWELAHGAIPDGLFVCHHCDNPKCVRIDHLFLGTAADNNADMRAKGRHATGELTGPRKHPERYPKGTSCHWAKLTEDDVRTIRKRYAAGNITQTALAYEYGVHNVTVSEIVLRKKWKHVD